jgi:hypothetical protein
MRILCIPLYMLEESGYTHPQINTKAGAGYGRGRRIYFLFLYVATLPPTLQVLADYEWPGRTISATAKEDDC